MLLGAEGSSELDWPGVAARKPEWLRSGELPSRPFNSWDGDFVVLVSFVLVLAAAVALVVGLLQSGLAIIYVSIGCSVVAGIVLAVAVLRGRPEARPAAAPGVAAPAPRAPPAPPPPPRAAGPAPA